MKIASHLVDWLFFFNFLAYSSIGIILSTFATAMEKFVPHKIDSEDFFESHLLGDVKAGFPSLAEGYTRKVRFY